MTSLFATNSAYQETCPIISYKVNLEHDAYIMLTYDTVLILHTYSDLFGLIYVHRLCKMVPCYASRHLLCVCVCVVFVYLHNYCHSAKCVYKHACVCVLCTYTHTHTHTHIIIYRHTGTFIDSTQHTYTYVCTQHKQFLITFSLM